ncbi:MAG: UDP-3-O-acyl-N-acetylglucosamine deacetylase [Coleofasciculus sp. S288]|nr:UDP-3-O-acyl-N-acetylglucosamine deacetylase [Coleofasciculus sp. S288]
MSRYTLGSAFECSGVGLHSGVQTTVRVMPAAAGEGRYFIRVDLPGTPVIPARVDAVSGTTLSTELEAPTGNCTGESHDVSATGDVRVRTVEHLLAALAGSGVDDARIEINGLEVPLLDGSAQHWVEAIANVGIVAGEGQFGNRAAGEDVITRIEVEDTSSAVKLQEPIWVYQGDAFVAALPAPTTRFTYGIDFDVPAIGNQWHSWTPSQESFVDAIAPARTFGLVHQIDQLRQAGLIKGGSLENALVCGKQGWLNPPLRFSNEPVRHKLLDLVGDLSLLGNFPVAHFLAYKASHNLHIQLAKKLAQQVGGRLDS